MKNIKLLANFLMVMLCISLITSCDKDNTDSDDTEKEPEMGIVIEDLVNSVWRPSNTFTTQLWKNQDKIILDAKTGAMMPNNEYEPFNALVSITDSICFGNLLDENNRQLVTEKLLHFGGYKIISTTLREGRTIPDVTYFDTNKTMCECSNRYPEIKHLGQYYLKIEFEPQIVSYISPFVATITTSYRNFEGDIYFINKNLFVFTYDVYCGDFWCTKGYYFSRIR